MNKSRFFVIPILVIALLLSNLHTAQAVPPTPSSFYGTIAFQAGDGGPIVGDFIDAYVPGVGSYVARIAITESVPNLVYAINVPGDDSETSPAKEGGAENDVVTFKIGTRVVGTGVWHTGTNVNLNIHPPKAIITGAATANEGQTISYSGTTSQDGGGDLSSHWFDWNNDGTYDQNGAIATPINHTWPDNGSFTMKMKVVDAQGGEGTTTLTVTVSNVAPTVTLSAGNTYTWPESSTTERTFNYTASDPAGPSSDPLAITPLCGTGGAYVAGSDNGSSFRCIFADGPASPTVSVSANDGDGGVGSDSRAVTVSNVAPTATFNAPASVSEGSNISLSLTAPVDPSSGDTTAGFQYAFDCGSGYGAWGATSTATCTTTDNGSRSVGGKIRDRDNDETVYNTSVTVINVAPTITLSAGNTYAWPESSTVERTFNYTASDPAGANDPLSITPLCGTGGAYVAGSDTGGSFRCIFANGPASPTVSVSANDNDGGVGIDGHAVIVINVAPTATFNAPASVNEGSDIALSLTAPVDPSNPDTVAGFQYAFDCGLGYGAWGLPSTATCSTTDNESRPVGGKIKDKDGGETVYNTSVAITDVLPTNVDAHGPYSGAAGQSVALVGSATCVAVDACTFAWDLDLDGAYDDATGTSPSHTWNTVGNYTIGLQVTDNDGNAVTDTATVNIGGATVSIDLEVGWNLVSFNLHPSDTAPAVVLASIAGNFDLVYAWDATGGHAGAGNWMKFDNVGATSDTLTALDETMGFWVHMTSADRLDVVGSIPTSTVISLWDNVGGWNLVSYPSSSSLAMPAALEDHGVLRANYTLVYAYHAVEIADPWKLYDTAAPTYVNDLTSMAPGWGYWVYIIDDDTWTVGY